MERDVYEVKYELLRKKYHKIQLQNEKLQNRIHHIRQQVQFMRSLKRIIIQKLLFYGDRFMEVCLEIPDMEPGANVEDKIIDVVAEAPKPPTPIPASASSAAAPINAKKKRNTTKSEPSQHRRPSSGVKVVVNQSQQLPGITVKVKSVINPANPSTTVVVGSSKKKKRYPPINKKPDNSPKIAAISRNSSEIPAVTDPFKSANLEEVVNSVIHESQQPPLPVPPVASEIINVPPLSPDPMEISTV